ncbi:MAG TPA: GTP-binding protein [Burkholderiaceae bacterium]|nr:GTP-binding protein [Burkholderiaceae bacterium]
MKAEFPPMPPRQSEDRGVLRFLTCGSVDDGKSTLIGRLLYDTKALLSDTLGHLERLKEKHGAAHVDLSLLTDGLVAEREQGITIDVAYRYFATARRKFIIADSPGHEQYTRNMVTAASTADVAIVLVDARKGVLPQTKRHATIARLLGIRQLIVAVNKMDLVGYDQGAFDAIVDSFHAWMARHDGAGVDVRMIPMSALDGAMVVERGDRMPWYGGPTLIDMLEDAPESQLDADAPLRLPVQWVCRPSQADHADFRGYAGRVEAGTIAVGDEVIALPNGARSRVTRIALGTRELQRAVAGQSVMVSLADERDISRGDMIVRAVDVLPDVRQQFSATICWLSSTALSVSRSYVLQHTTRSVKTRFTAVSAHLDIHALAWGAGQGHVALNDIVRVQFKTQQPLVADPYAVHRDTGSFIIIDEATNDTVAAGMIDGPVS